MTPAFVPGLELSAAFYQEAVAPVLAGQPHAAALLGWGSDVLGFDTERSTDHGWGPRVLVFLPPADTGSTGTWTGRLERHLPATFRGWPVRFGWDAAPAQHWATVTTLSRWTQEHLGVDATSGLTYRDWLTIRQQRVLGVVAGAVHTDRDGELAALRHDLAWFPDQVWYWLVACQWARVAQEEAFAARTAETGDEAGSAITTARQAREIMRLALLLHRQYAPYQKWLGTAFARLPHADALQEHVRAAVRAPDSNSRQSALAAAYRSIADQHNAAGITSHLDTNTGPYHSRPAQVLMAGRFAQAALARVDDPWLRGLPLIGAVDQFVDSSDLLRDPELWRRAASAYGPTSSAPSPE